MKKRQTPIVFFRDFTSREKLFKLKIIIYILTSGGQLSRQWKYLPIGLIVLIFTTMDVIYIYVAGTRSDESLRMIEFMKIKNTRRNTIDLH